MAKNLESGHWSKLTNLSTGIEEKSKQKHIND